MKKILFLILVSLICRVAVKSQDQNVKKDTTALPRLEIPEITIVGKKAITLPFARKGEIYDVSIYEAPQPDSSILEKRISMSLPIGSLPRYDEPLVPWHLSAEGSYGSFATVHFRSFLDYYGKNWGMYGNGGFNSTNGHIAGASGNSYQMEMNAHSIISTDNEILKSFRAFGRFNLAHEKFGMFGLKSMNINRSRTNVLFDARLNSLDRESGVIDFDLGAYIWSLSDNAQPYDSSASSISPQISVAYKTKIDEVQLLTNISYTGSSLSYDHPVQSSSLLNADASAKWMMLDKWFLQIGGKFNTGSGTDGTSRTLISPVASLKWELDQDRMMSVWFQPEMRLASYGDLTKVDPYLVREIAIKPERIPFNLGGTFFYNSEIMTVEVAGGFSTSSNKSVTIADSGKIHLEYLSANQFRVQANGSIKPTGNTSITFSGVIQPTFETGKSIQLPSTPLFQFAGRGEMTFDLPLTLSSSIELWSKQNVDLAGTKTIGDRILIGIGASTTIIPKTVLTLDVTNLLNQKYELWSWYQAPGIAVNIQARINVR